MFSRRLFSKLANNYSPLPITIMQGKDIFLWDDKGKKYVDLLAGYSAVNQGHCHPKIVNALTKQASKVTLTSRVVNSEALNDWSEYVTNKFAYDKVLAMNSGAEAVETAIKLSRKYGYQILKMKNPHIISLTNNFHGRTLGTLSLSNHQQYREGFGPFDKNIIYVEMNNPEHLDHVFKLHSQIISAILYEPIQGEGGVMPMHTDFVNALQRCKKEYPHVLFMADEIQCGLARIGSLTASERIYPNLKPDVLILGKALSGGMIPLSCVLANNEVMQVFTPGTHGSTFGGNPLACTVSIEALKVIDDECIPNVKNIEPVVQKLLCNLHKSSIIDVRGMGLFWGIQFDQNYNIETLRLKMLDAGYITCTSRNNTIRITPPLTINEKEIEMAIHKLDELI